MQYDTQQHTKTKAFHYGVPGRMVHIFSGFNIRSALHDEKHVSLITVEDIQNRAHGSIAERVHQPVESPDRAGAYMRRYFYCSCAAGQEVCYFQHDPTEERAEK